MNSTVSLVLKIALLIAIALLGYKLYDIIKEPIRFEEIKEERYSAIKERLENIRDVQKLYRAEFNEFAKDFNTLIAFVDTGKQTIIERKDSSFTYYDEIYMQERSKDTTIVRVLGYESVKNNLFSKDFDASQLQYIPYTDKAEFEMSAKKIKVSDIIVPVFEAKAPNELIFADIQKKYDQFIDKDYALTVGSLTEPTISGNWK